MAGSRREKLGSIFVRMTGLLRSGALKEEDRPIWYDVVKALPPKPIPSPKQIPVVFYPEDFVRAHFFETFCEPVRTVLTNEKIKSVPQRFVDKYLELQSQKAVPVEQLFDETVRVLKEEGVKLVTHQEKNEADKTRRDSLSRQPKESAERGDHRQSLPERSDDGTRRMPQPVDLATLFKENS